MNKQLDPKKPMDNKTKAAPAPAPVAQAQPKASLTQSTLAPKANEPAKKVAAPAPAAPVQPAAPKLSLHAEVDKLVVEATRNYEHKKTVKTELVHEVKELKVVDDDKKTKSTLVVYLPYVYVKNHRGLLSKLVNDIQNKKKMPVFLVSHRTLLNPKSAHKQQIPRSRTLTQVYDSVLEDLVSPATIIGKRMRYHLDGTQHTKVFLSDESKAFLENKMACIPQIYKQLTNRKVTLEFRPESSYIRVPLIKAPRQKQPKRNNPKKEAAVAAQ